MGKLKLVGIGPGSPDYITPIAKKSVQNAEIVIGAKRALNLFQDHIKGESLPLTAQNVKESLKYAVESAEAGKNVTILSTGDPGFSGLLGSLINIAGKNVDVDVIPGISSIQVCAARLRMRWDTADLLSFHGEASHEKKMRLVEALKDGKKVMLLPDPKSFSPTDIAKFLIDHGIDKETSVSVCENLTLGNERTVTSTLDGILKQNFDLLCVMVVGADHKQKDHDTVESVDMRVYKTLGIPDDNFIQSNKVPGPTKEEIRVVTISKARLCEASYVVDVGCGTGSLTVEAALQVSPKGKVFAIDDDEEAVELTKSNVTKFQVKDVVQVICGKAPEVMLNLPEIDAVIIGGSASLREVIHAAHQKLKKNGRIVINAILLETAVKALDELKKLNFKDLDVAQIFVAKGREVSSGTMMLARNPITVISATKM